MSEMVARGNGVFFENKLSPQEKKEAEYRNRVRRLEEKVSRLEDLVMQLYEIIDSKEM